MEKIPLYWGQLIDSVRYTGNTSLICVLKSSIENPLFLDICENMSIFSKHWTDTIYLFSRSTAWVHYFSSIEIQNYESHFTLLLRIAEGHIFFCIGYKSACTWTYLYWVKIFQANKELFLLLRKTNVFKAITAKTHCRKQNALREKLIRRKKTVCLSKALATGSVDYKANSKG